MAEYENLIAELEKERNLRIEAEKRVKWLEAELLRLTSNDRPTIAVETVTVVEQLIEEKTHMEKEVEQLKHDMMTMRMEREKVSVFVDITSHAWETLITCFPTFVPGRTAERDRARLHVQTAR